MWKPEQRLVADRSARLFVTFVSDLEVVVGRQLDLLFHLAVEAVGNVLKDSIDHAPNGHDDLANAVAGAAAATRSKYTYDTSLDWIAGPDADAA
jgi:hypothetical protein